MKSKELVEFARSALFVPGTKPERFGKARSSGADLAIFDLEDSVLHSEKDLALENILVALKNNVAGSGIVVRVNSDRLATELPVLFHPLLLFLQQLCESCLATLDSDQRFLLRSQLMPHHGLLAMR